MLIRIVDNQVLNADIAQRFSFAHTSLREESEPLWYLGIHWMDENTTVLALREDKTLARTALVFLTCNFSVLSSLFSFF